MKAVLAALVLAVGLAGCATKVVEEKVVYKFVGVPKEMTEKCPITPPPDPVKYSVLPWDQQEGLLMGLIQEHTTSIGKCNARLTGVDTWSEKQRLIYEKPAAPAK